MNRTAGNSGATSSARRLTRSATPSNASLRSRRCCRSSQRGGRRCDRRLFVGSSRWRRATAVRAPLPQHAQPPQARGHRASSEDRGVYATAARAARAGGRLVDDRRRRGSARHPDFGCDVDDAITVGIDGCTRQRSGQPAAPSASAASGSADRRAPANQPVAAPETPAATPIVVAVSISPLLVRGGSEPAELTMSGGVDIVRLHLNSQVNEPRLGRGHAIVRTVIGREVWRGPAVEVKETSAALARVTSLLLRSHLMTT